MMKKLVPILVVAAILVAAVVPVLVQADTASACTVEPRTPGYWKNHASAWVGYSPTDNFRAIFGVGPDASLMDVLRTGGGKWDALHRHAVAALLNSTSGSDFDSTADVIAAVRWAYSHNDWESVKDYLEAANESGA